MEPLSIHHYKPQLKLIGLWTTSDGLLLKNENALDNELSGGKENGLISFKKPLVISTVLVNQEYLQTFRFSSDKKNQFQSQPYTMLKLTEVDDVESNPNRQYEGFAVDMIQVIDFEQKVI